MGTKQNNSKSHKCSGDFQGGKKVGCLFAGMLFYGIGSNPNEFASFCAMDYVDY